jgi:hypothetical protein
MRQKTDKEEITNDNRKTRKYLPIGLALGAGVGVALGSAFDSIGMGIALGVGCGIAIGAAIDRQQKNKNA